MASQAIPKEYSVFEEKDNAKKSCLFVLQRPHVQLGHTGYRSAAFRQHAFAQCVLNERKGFFFDYDYLAAIDNNSKASVVSNKCGDLDGGVEILRP